RETFLEKAEKGDSMAKGGTKTVSNAQKALEPYSIGVKLRLLRTQKKLTLSRLSAETRLSTALLSKLETDRMIPTLPTLAAISRVYGVGLSYFFSEPGRHTLSITRKAHLEGQGRSQESMRATPLNVVREGTRLVAQAIEFPAAGAAAAMNPFHETNAVLYVLEGKLELDAGGVRETLSAGDCACLESEMELAWSATGKDHCRVLAVFAAESGEAA
ncbi:MAG TPA: XRE family transcriptional regulator, partial [Terracidiphilus sp.]|nr:XRE family transcriptional regulator [Terracidiphilus sp.]